jgi:hypothetical protein
MKDDQIPKGHYCYRPINISNKKASFEILVCPYWQKTNGGARCNLLNISSEDYESESLIWDSVKECDINLGTEDDE